MLTVQARYLQNRVNCTASTCEYPGGLCMQYVKYICCRVAACVVGLGLLVSESASATNVDMWDGRWHYDATIYSWLPWVYTTVQLPPIAGGGNPTIETDPGQYLKDVQGGALVQGGVRKGPWSIWTDLVYLHVESGNSHTRQIGLPGGDPTLTVTRALSGDLHAAIWTLAPAYTVIRNDVATLDVLVGLRFSSVRVSLSYTFTAPPTALMRSGGFSPVSDSTDGIVGLKGTVRLSNDGKWYLAYEGDIGDGNKNWQYNIFLVGGYRFDWGDVSLGLRNLTYEITEQGTLDKVRLTGPVLGATFRW